MKRWLIILFIVGLGFGYYGYRMIFSSNVKTPDGKDTEIFIPTGADYLTVANKLQEGKFLSDIRAFHMVSRMMNYTHTVKPGRYVLEDGMSSRELITKLRSGDQSPVKFTFVKFRTKDQLAEHVGNKLEMDKDEFLAVLNDKDFLKKHNGLNPETAMTIFIPNTYEMWWNVKPKDFFKRMFSEYKKFWNEERNAKRQKLKLNRLEVMALASIVEEETNKNDEKSKVAGVYLNRIRSGMPLQADPTVKYAVGDFTLRRILNKHLQVDSPYNTYLYPGIPPAPICTPSIPSIEAVLAGERHQYYYFCANIDGSGYHKFSESLSEHNAYAKQYHQMLNQRGIR
ncbi:MAG: endolytic transglycosylase MltG [Bacteroidota bacterium]